MNGQPAIILSEYDLEHMVRNAARQAAQEVIDGLLDDLKGNPNDAVVRNLRAFIEDRSTVANPREVWANGLHIRSIYPGRDGKPKSTSWFQQFKIKSGLNDCLYRKSRSAGGTREWCVEDIANAWERVR